MRLIFIASSHGYHGENGDLFVVAETRDQAIELWRKHYELEAKDKPDRVFEVPVVVKKKIGRAPRALGWHKEIVEL